MVLTELPCLIWSDQYVRLDPGEVTELGGYQFEIRISDRGYHSQPVEEGRKSGCQIRRLHNSA